MGEVGAEPVPQRDRDLREPTARLLVAPAGGESRGQCFLDRGYAATTMRDIAKAAGVSVQTVFG